MFDIINKIKIDKYKHLAVSAGLAAVLKSSMVLAVGYVPAAVLAFFVTMSIGIGKEIYDKRTGSGKCEWQDLVADVIGALIGSV